VSSTPSPSSTRADVVIIGGGPGGYVAAIRAAQLGLTTVCVEQDATLGGTCVNVGCIPSKALLTSSERFEFTKLHSAEHGFHAVVTLDLPRMMKRKDDVVLQNTRGIEYLFRKHKITWAKGRGTLGAGNVVTVTDAAGGVTGYEASHVIIATGSVPAALPFLPFDEERVLSNVGALRIPGVPEHLVVIGAGVIGLELGSVWRRLGARVTVLELAPTILPGYDADVIKTTDKIFRQQGMDLRTAVRVTGARRDGGHVAIDYQTDGGATAHLDSDYVLVAVGRRPSLAGIDAARLGLQLGPSGEILVDDQMRTNLPRVFAIGDAVGGKLLAHKAQEEGVVAAEVIAGQPSRMHYRSIPAIVYTWPEVAAVGLAEHEVKAIGRPYKVGRFPFSANGRARTLGDTSGFVKFVADAETGELLGAHMVGPGASELIAEVVLAFEYRGTAEDVGATVHAHPTLSEATKEAALAVLGRPIHV
jgi:dihydrolipoyl dehydrogenase